MFWKKEHFSQMIGCTKIGSFTFSQKAEIMENKSGDQKESLLAYDSEIGIIEQMDDRNCTSF